MKQFVKIDPKLYKSTLYNINGHYRKIQYSQKTWKFFTILNQLEDLVRKGIIEDMLITITKD